MYTQCPECGVAFRVTAEVLRQAAGKVRCGGCGVAFNALAHLSEEKPRAPARRQREQKLPELTPEDPPELEPDTPPRAISAAQSAALLKTLDQLAGPDVRIEDTGVEWRVLDDDEVPAGEQAEPELIADTGTLRFIVQDDEGDGAVDEILEDSPTPVDQLLTDTPTEVDAPEIFDEMRFDDNTPLPEDFDMDAPAPAPPPAPEPVAHREPFEDAQVDLELGDPDEWEDLLGEVNAAAAANAGKAVEDDDDVPDAAGIEVTEEPAGDSGDQPLDLDTQFDIQAEALGIDVSGRHARPAPEDDAADELETSLDEDLINAAFETEAEAEEGLELEFTLAGSEDEELVDEIGPAPVDERSLTIRLDGDDESGSPGRPDEHVVPEMTEEEMTINMLIDQDLLSVAVEDEDGFATTIVQAQPDRKVEDEIDDNRERSAADRKKPPGAPAKAGPKPFETIVMEGEEIRDALVDKQKEKNRRLVEEAMKAAREDEEKRSRTRGRPKPGMIAAAVLLVVVLLLQVLHQSREALATMPMFNDAVGPLYRMVGKPLTPAWDITGWRIEATKGSTDTDATVLTIYSRIGNESGAAMPYPLIHVSLTDRYLEPIGNRVLEPAEYLGADADPREPVAAGNTFDAVIAIESPDPDAASFTLNVCYRRADGRLRCADKNFK